MNSYAPSYSYMPLVLCDYCEFSDHDAHTCPYHAYVDATCASLKEDQWNDWSNDKDHESEKYYMFSMF